MRNADAIRAMSLALEILRDALIISEQERPKEECAEDDQEMVEVMIYGTREPPICPWCAENGISSKMRITKSSFSCKVCGFLGPKCESTFHAFDQACRLRSALAAFEEVPR